MVTRTRSAVKNIYFSLLYQGMNVILKFVMRTIFIYCLGKEYLGISGVFSNVLSLLSLTELGLGSAIIYSMYKPIAEGDQKKLIQLVDYYRRIYFAIGMFIIACGSLLMPFLDHIIKDIPNIPHIYLIYLLFLVQSSVSYFFAHSISLLEAEQAGYEYKKISMWVSIIKSIGQCIFLLLCRNYILYLLLDILFLVLSNYLAYQKAVKLFPFIRKKVEKLPAAERKTVWKNAMDCFSIKVGGTLLYSTDNLLISMLVSTIFVGLYSNYAMVIQIILTTAVLLQRAVMPGIGNACVEKDPQQKQRLYHNLFFLYGGIFSFVSACMYLCFQPFIRLWLGADYLLDTGIVWVMILNCYLSGVHQVNETFIFSDGLYRYFRWKPWAEAILNLLLSIVLGKIFGVLGVCLGTLFSHLLLTFWYDGWIVYKYSLYLNVSDYFKRYIGYFLCAALTIIGLEVGISHIIQLKLSGMAEILFYLVAAALVTVILWFCIFFRSEEFCYFMNFIKKRRKKRDV